MGWGSGGSKFFENWRRSAEDNVSSPSSFIANAHNELPIIPEKAALKNLSEWGDRPPPPWICHWMWMRQKWGSCWCWVGHWRWWSQLISRSTLPWHAVSTSRPLHFFIRHNVRLCLHLSPDTISSDRKCQTPSTKRTKEWMDRWIVCLSVVSMHPIGKRSAILYRNLRGGGWLKSGINQ